MRCTLNFLPMRSDCATRAKNRSSLSAFDFAGAILNYINMSFLPIICFVYRELNLPLAISLLVFCSTT